MKPRGLLGKLLAPFSRWRGLGVVTVNINLMPPELRTDTTQRDLAEQMARAVERGYGKPRRGEPN